MERKTALHIVDESSRFRAELARVGFGLGHHAEVYSELDEFTARPPEEGIVLLRDDGTRSGIVHAIDRLASANCWLPVIVTAVDPRSEQIVAAIKAGALGYLPLPVIPERLARILNEVGEEAKAYARARRKFIEARNRIGCLSPREREVLDWLSQGFSNKAIARELDISPRTVEIHRANMMAKLGASHPADAVRLQMEAQAGQDLVRVGT